ncbi:hypothetical protein [Planomonospora sphaerica]|uniref:hypothetical protein n=1 Tax=Planomonospora sphaerica TaxID=161355 RepID=UPI00083A03C4|nr:hypothetical protein [Planomonospora sphaerica]
MLRTPTAQAVLSDPDGKLPPVSRLTKNVPFFFHNGTFPPGLRAIVQRMMADRLERDRRIDGAHL